jgi:hypothetical protein
VISAGHAENRDEKLRENRTLEIGPTGGAENGNVFPSQSAAKPTVPNGGELLYFRDLCGESAELPAAPSTTSTKKEKIFVLKEQTWS